MNIFHGKSVLSSFKMDRGYAPSVLDIKSRIFTLELQEAHIQLVATRALQKGNNSRNNTISPRSSFESRGNIWRLMKIPYGITETGLQRTKEFGRWLVTEARFERVFGAPQLFIKMGKDGEILVIMEKVTDDLLMTSTESQIKSIVEQISMRFTIRKAIINSNKNFNGSDIEKDRTICLSMERYMKEMNQM